MPIYEYRCKACDHHIEVMQSMSSDPLTTCDQCGAPEGLKKLISNTSFVLKGSGWYATDYKKASEPAKKDSAPSSSEKKSSSDAASTSTAKKSTD
jgi:putative FmdB family regulatory protein